MPGAVSTLGAAWMATLQPGASLRRLWLLRHPPLESHHLPDGREGETCRGGGWKVAFCLLKGREFIVVHTAAWLEASPASSVPNFPYPVLTAERNWLHHTVCAHQQGPEPLAGCGTNSEELPAWAMPSKSCPASPGSAQRWARRLPCCHAGEESTGERRETGRERRGRRAGSPSAPAGAGIGSGVVDHAGHWLLLHHWHRRGCSALAERLRHQRPA